MNCYIIVGKKDKKLKCLGDLDLMGCEAAISYSFNDLQELLNDNKIKGCKVIEVPVTELYDYVD